MINRTLVPLPATRLSGHAMLVAALGEGGHIFSRFLCDHTLSSATAIPCPTPMHMVDSDRLPPLRTSSSAAVPVMRAPDMPKG